MMSSPEACASRRRRISVPSLRYIPRRSFTLSGSQPLTFTLAEQVLASRGEAPKSLRVHQSSPVLLSVGIVLHDLPLDKGCVSRRSGKLYLVAFAIFMVSALVSDFGAPQAYTWQIDPSFLAAEGEVAALFSIILAS